MRAALGAELAELERPPAERGRRGCAGRRVGSARAGAVVVARFKTVLAAAGSASRSRTTCCGTRAAEANLRSELDKPLGEVSKRAWGLHNAFYLTDATNREFYDAVPAVWACVRDAPDGACRIRGSSQLRQYTVPTDERLRRRQAAGSHRRRRFRPAHDDVAPLFKNPDSPRSLGGGMARRRGSSRPRARSPRGPALDSATVSDGLTSALKNAFASMYSWRRHCPAVCRRRAAVEGQPTSGRRDAAVVGCHSLSGRTLR